MSLARYESISDFESSVRTAADRVLSSHSCDRRVTGIVAASSFGSVRTRRRLWQQCRELERVNLKNVLIPDNVPSSAVGNTARYFGLGGTCLSISCGTAGMIAALAVGDRMIRQGRIEYAICCYVEEEGPSDSAAHEAILLRRSDGGVHFAARIVDVAVVRFWTSSRLTTSTVWPSCAPPKESMSVQLFLGETDEWPCRDCVDVVSLLPRNSSVKHHPLRGSDLLSAISAATHESITGVSIIVSSGIGCWIGTRLQITDMAIEDV